MSTGVVVTSMSGPAGAGPVGLMVEAAGRPLTIEETRRALFRSAEPVPVAAGEAAPRAGDGYLDVSAAVEAARAAAPVPVRLATVATNGHAHESSVNGGAETVAAARRCFAPPVAEDPTDFGSFPVG